MLTLTIAWTMLAGKDASWDVFNHHLYLPFSLLTGRYTQDLFAAGPQSYQNPIGYVPFYLLVRAGLPSWLAGVALAALNAALIAWPLHRVALSIWGAGAESRSWRWLAIVAAWCAPAFLIVAGTSSIDPLCAGLSLIGLAAALEPRPRFRLLLAGGVALGLAVALKPSSAVFAIAVGAVGLVRGLAGQWRWPVLLAFWGATIGGFVAGAGFWSAWLWANFGNPFFPLFNQFFASPFAPAGPTVAYRFLPASPLDFVSRLWEMAEFRAYTVTEAFVPDLRPLPAVVGVSVGLVAAIWRGRAPAAMRRAFWSRADVQLAVATFVAYLLWMATSGNARYAVAWFMMIGVVLVRAAQVSLPAPAAKVALGVVLALQMFVYVGSGDRRFMELAWDSRPYLVIGVPKRLVETPFLHLSTGMQSYASVASYLHPEGALINVSGQITLPADGPLGSELRRRLEAWRGKTRFLFLAPPRIDEPEIKAMVSAKSRFIAYRLGLAVDWSDCEKIWIDGDAYGSLDSRSPLAASKMHRADAPLMSCRAVTADLRDENVDRELAVAEEIFALIESRCPRIFSPIPLATDIGDGVFQRRYTNTDARVNVSRTDGVTMAHFRSLNAVSLGSIEHVVANKGLDACKAWQALSMQ